MSGVHAALFGGEMDLEPALRHEFLEYARDRADGWHVKSRFGWRRYVDQVEVLASSIPRDARVLDVGCGYGQIAALLRLRRADLSVYGVDLREHAIWAELQRRYGCILTVGDALGLKFADEHFDVVYAFGVMEHVNFDEPMGRTQRDVDFLREIYRLLKPGGRVFLFYIPNRYSWTEALARRLRGRGIFAHRQLYRVGELVRLLETAGFDRPQIDRHGLFPTHLGKLVPLAGRWLDQHHERALRVEGFLLKTPLGIFSTNFSVEAQKATDSCLLGSAREHGAGLILKSVGRQAFRARH